MRAVIYARYSSDRQREESAAAQIRACEQYCSRKGYTVVNHYVDEAKTGRNDRRAHFQQMIKDAKLGTFDIVVAHKVDRVFRHRYDAAVYKRELTKSGVVIEYSEQQFNRKDNSSVLMEGLMETLAEYYSLNLADETMKGLKENAYQAKFNGGYPPFGFEIIDGKYVVNEYEAQGVQAIFKMCSQGKGYKDILQHLQSRGYKTRQGKDFGKNSLTSILSNPKYMGTYTFNKIKRSDDGSRNSHSPSDEIITVEDSIPAIISKELFEAVQQKKEANRKRPGAFAAKHQYFLTGYINCGECGAAMQGKTSTNRGKLYFRYYCGDRERKVSQCDNPLIHLIELEDFVLDQISQRLLSPTVMPELLDKITQAYASRKTTFTSELSGLENQRSGLKAKIGNLINFIENGNVNTNVMARLDENEKNLAIIETRIKDVRAAMSRQVLDRKQVSALFAHYQDLLNRKDPDSVRVLINTFLEQVTVYKDHVDVTLRISVGLLGAREGT